jgi:hypothetical protein
VEVSSVSRFGRFFTDKNVPGFQWKVFAPYLLSLSVCWCSFVVNSCLVSDIHVSSYFISVLNMHVWFSVMSLSIMLLWRDFCTQLTTLNSTHNTQRGRFYSRLVLTSLSCAGGELCCVASLLKSNGQTQVVDGHKWNICVIFWCKNKWKRFVKVCFIAKANDDVISHGVLGYHRIKHNLIFIIVL